MKRLFILLAAVIGFVSLTSPINIVSAQDNKEERITLSPAVSRPELEAGQQAEGKLTVINDGQVPYSFVLYARPFSVKNESYEPNYTEVNDRTEAYQWVQFEKTQLELKPGERTEIGYTMTVPQNASPGGHYAVLFAETQPSNDQSSVARKKRVGSLLYITISGDLSYQGKLASWEAQSFQTKAPVASLVRIENSGNVHFIANATITYDNIFGKKQFEQNQEMIILPGTTRRLSVNWEKPPLFGIYKASGSVEMLDRTESLEGKWIIYVPASVLWVLGGAVVLIVGAVAARKISNKKTNQKDKNGAGQ